MFVLVPLCCGGVNYTHVGPGEFRAKFEPRVKCPRIEGEARMEGEARD